MEKMNLEVDVFIYNVLSNVLLNLIYINNKIINMIFLQFIFQKEVNKERERLCLKIKVSESYFVYCFFYGEVRVKNIYYNKYK